MHPMASAIRNELEAVQSQLVTLLPNGEQSMSDIWGWNAPPLSRFDLESIIATTYNYLARLPTRLGSEEVANKLNSLLKQVAKVRGNMIPNMAAGPPSLVVLTLVDLLDRIRRFVDTVVSPFPPPPPPIDWEKMAADNMLPRRLTSRIRSVEASLRNIEPRAEAISDKIVAIENAYETAERLPTDLATLAEGQREIAAARTSAAKEAEDAGKSALRAAEEMKKARLLAAEADTLFANLEKVYRAASTAGLAKAFGKRALWLNVSVGVWVLLLMIALVAGAWIGTVRFEALEKILERPLPASTFWGNVVLSLFSLAAPVWFAWVATKQIGQRFRLAEDYGFKSSVALAYEGYRSEATRHDPELERRLFSSALTRLEEAPLRFVETEHFGTPWQELTSSPAFLKALNLVPELKTTLAGVVATAGAAVAGAAITIKQLGTAPSRSSAPAQAGDAADGEQS